MAKKQEYPPELIRKRRVMLREVSRLLTKLEKHPDKEKEIYAEYAKLLGRDLTDLTNELLQTDMSEVESLFSYSEYQRKRGR